MRKKKYTNAEIFHIIINCLKKKDLIPPILDYYLSSADIKVIKSDEWEAIGRVTFGGNEGIYLTIYMEGIIDKGYERIELGTFKKLETSKEAYKAMSDLNVEFIFELRDFVGNHPESFCWTGYDVKFVTYGKTSRNTLWFSSKERAVKAIKKHISTHTGTESVIVKNNETNETRTYNIEEFFDC